MYFKYILNRILGPNERNLVLLLIVRHLKTIINLKPEPSFNKHLNKLTIVTRPYLHLVNFRRATERQIDIDGVREVDLIEEFNIRGDLFLVDRIGNVIRHPKYHAFLLRLDLDHRFEITKPTITPDASLPSLSALSTLDLHHQFLLSLTILIRRDHGPVGLSLELPCAHL